MADFLVLGAGMVGRRPLIRPPVRLACLSALFVIISYAPFFAPARAATFFGLMVFWSFFCSTAIILCDQVLVLADRRSLLAAITAGSGPFLRFVATGAASGLLLDGFAQWLGKLWVYPFWNLPIYASTFVLGFCAYWLLLAETYLAAKAGLRRLLGRKAPSRGLVPSGLLAAGAAAGTTLLLAGIAIAADGYRAAGGYRFDINQPSPVAVSFWSFPLAFAGVWLLLETALRRRGSPSLLWSLRHGDPVPLAAILLSAWTFGIFMETVNAAQHFWRYTRWPLESLNIAGVPATVVLFWPLQYVVFLSVFALVARQEARLLWD